MNKVLKFLYDTQDLKKRELLLLLLSFVPTVVIARTYSVITGNSIYIRGYQIHHFYFGMLCLAIGGLLALLVKRSRAQGFASILIGVGLGLFVDEIGLLLNCTTINRVCSYYFPDALDIFGVTLILIVGLTLIVDIEELYSHTEAPARKK